MEVEMKLHIMGISAKAMQEELRARPLRIEEKKDFSYFGGTPLMAAACFGNVNVIRFLLAAGANIEAKNEVIFV